MTIPRDPDLIIAGWLDGGPEHLPQSTRRAIEVTTRTARQVRRPIWVPARSPNMNPIARLLAVAAAVAVAIGGLMLVVSPGGRAAASLPPVLPTTSPPLPAASPTPTLRSSPTPARPVLSDFRQTFTSSLYGYSVRYPDGWTAKPGSGPIRPGSIPEARTPEVDSIGLAASEMVVLVAAEPVPAGMTEATWAASIDGKVPESFGFAAGCPTSTTALVVDGEPATEFAFDDCPVATFMWVTTVHHGLGYQIIWVDYARTPLADAQKVFDGFLLTFTFVD